MSRRKVKINDDRITPKLITWSNVLSDLIQPKNLYVIAGRGSAKTTGIMAKRAQHVCLDMPRSKQMFIASTYADALSNVVPSILEGWNRNGWIKGTHYVTDERPPEHFKSCYKPIESYKHTITTYLGNVIKIGSLDQPSGLAGDSFQHIYGDEARLLKKVKLDRLSPALRGEFTLFGRSVFYRGKTFTTDMPNILRGDDDWILSMEKTMDQEQIQTILQAAFVLNQLKSEYVAAIQINDLHQAALLQKRIIKWQELWVRARKNSTYFTVLSSYVNVDILTEGYFDDALESLGIEEFKSAILSLRVNITKGEKFYTNLREDHFFEDGVDNRFYDRFPLGAFSKEDQTSEALRYIDHHAKLEIGVDFGDMCSMPVAQTKNKVLRVLKEFYTLAPENDVELGAKFCQFFRNHKRKEVDMYYDRSGNQNSKTKRDWASAVKRAIEYTVTGQKTGWVVNMMNENQRNIEQEEEFNFCKMLMSDTIPELPKLLIDRYQCPCLKNSLELTKIQVKVRSNGSRYIAKDKSSEKLPIHMRPMYSTNFSDGFKYLVFRPEFVNKVYAYRQYNASDPSII